MLIPNQLRSKQFKFVKLGKCKSQWCKNPIEKDYYETNNYQYDDPALIEHIGHGYNYGIICGIGNLLVLDFDEATIQQNLISLLPKTFTVKTGGKGLYHMYYIVDEPFRKFPLKDEKERVLMDFLCKGSFAVAPGSIHDSGKAYEVVNDCYIAKIRKSDLKRIFTKWDEPIFKKIYVKNIQFEGPLQKIIRNVTVRDVLAKLGVTTFVRGSRYKCPLHGGSNPYNAYVDDAKGLWYCHHCQKGGNVIDLWMAYHGCDVKKTIEDLR